MKKQKTILVIEDSNIISEIIALRLKISFNCSVIIFNNGDDIVNQIKKYLPDLVVLDYNFNDSKLKYKNGLEVLVELRKQTEVPVIVFSGQTDKIKALEMIRRGANDYINKDNDDFMLALLQSVRDIFEIQTSKSKMAKLNKNFNNGFLVLFFVVFFMVFVLNNILSNKF